MTPDYRQHKQHEQTADGLDSAFTSPWTEPFQQTDANVWSDTAMQGAEANQQAKRAAEATEEAMRANHQANHHMDDQTRNALSTIFYGN